MTLPRGKFKHAPQIAISACRESKVPISRMQKLWDPKLTGVSTTLETAKEKKAGSSDLGWF